MKLRWFRVIDRFGESYEWELQFWSDKIEGWVDIPYIECYEKDEAKFMAKPLRDEDYFNERY